MNPFGGGLSSLIALTAHVAICVTGVSVLGVAGLWLCRLASAPLRHALAFGLLLAILVVPPIAALYHYRLIRFDLSAATTLLEAPRPALARDAEGSAPPIDEPAAAVVTQISSSNWSFAFSAVFAGVWMAGLLGLVGRTILTNRRRRQYIAAFQPVRDAYAIALVDRLGRTLGIGRSVQLLTSRETPCPFAVGLVRPRIIVPGELLEESFRDRFEAVLLHELAHVRRCDCAIAAVEELAWLVYWWNPLVATIASHLAAAREEICDGYVLNHAGDGRSLADYLLRSAEKAAHSHIRFVMALSVHDPLTLRRRITQLLNGDRNTMIRISPFASSILIVAVIVLAMAVTHENYAHAQLQFGPVVNAGNLVNTGVHEDPTAISSDGLTLYFNSGANVGPVIEMYRAGRTSINSPWTTVTPITELNTSRNDFGIRYVSPDQLTAFYASEGHAASPNVPHNRLLYTTRASTADPWSPGLVMPAPIDAPGWDSSPTVYANGLRVIFDSERPGGSGQLDLWEGRRSLVAEPWVVTNLGSAVNTSSIDRAPFVSGDGLMMFFASDRPGGFGDADIWMCQRPSIDAAWNPPVNLGSEINNHMIQSWPVFWPEGMTLIFRSNGHGGFGGNDIFSAAIVPEPSNGSLFLSGSVSLAALFYIRAKRNRYASRTRQVAPVRFSSSVD